MKSFTIFGLIAFVLLLLPVSSSGQIQNTIAVTTDKTSYTEGEIILITGEVRDLYAGTPVSVIVKAPTNDLVSIMQLAVSADKKFETEMTAGGSLMQIEGTYTILVQYGNTNRSATTSFEYGDSQSPSFEFSEDETTPKIPDWVKNTAKWWSQDSINDESFVNSIQYLIQERIIKITQTTQGQGSGSHEIPTWIKNNAKWWSEGAIDDDTFIQGIKFLINEGTIRVD